MRLNHRMQAVSLMIDVRKRNAKYFGFYFRRWV